MNYSEITAVFGGTFDPPHLGHREAVLGLFENPGVCRVIVIPSAIPPQKQSHVSVEHRLEMIKLCFSSTQGDVLKHEIQIDPREITRAGNSGKPSYTYDTLQELKKNYEALAFVMGSDQLKNLHTWYRYKEILNLCHWIILERKNESAESSHKILSELKMDGVVVPTKAPPYSSTQIRQEIARTGMPRENSLFPPVLTYLKENRLYGISTLQEK